MLSINGFEAFGKKKARFAATFWDFYTINATHKHIAWKKQKLFCDVFPKRIVNVSIRLDQTDINQGLDDVFLVRR